MVPLSWLCYLVKPDGTGEARRILIPSYQHCHKYSTRLKLPVTQQFKIFAAYKFWIWQKVPSPRRLYPSYKNPVLAKTCSFLRDWEVNRILAWIIGQCCSYKLSNTTMPLILKTALFDNIKIISKNKVHYYICPVYKIPVFLCYN